MPLCSAVTYAGVRTVPSAPNVGAVHTTSYVCHSPGGRDALTSGGFCL
jgi:hypothetical protein